jgi:hypothetical protein
MFTLARALRTASLLIAVSTIALAANADVTLYSDGAPSGAYSAWTINYGFQVQDSFNLSSASTLTGVTFGSWLSTGDTASAVDWAIVTTEGTQTLACAGCSGTATLTPDGSFSVTGFSGFSGVDQSFSLPDLSLSAGTYWLELQNLVTNDGDPGYWDMNGGPSSVWENSFNDQTGSNCSQGNGPGTCSNSFTIVGTTGAAATPEPSSLALLGSGLTLLAAEIRRRRSATR